MSAPLCGSCGIRHWGICGSTIVLAERQGLRPAATTRPKPPEPGEPCPTCGHKAPMTAAQRKANQRKKVKA